MNIFEDLVEELKEANLLEETVTDTVSVNVSDKNLPLPKEPAQPDFINKLKEPVFPEVSAMKNSTVSVFPVANTPKPANIFQVNTDPNIVIKPEDLPTTDLYKTTKLSAADLPVGGDFGSFIDKESEESEESVNKHIPISIYNPIAQPTDIQPKNPEQKVSAPTLSPTSAPSELKPTFPQSLPVKTEVQSQDFSNISTASSETNFPVIAEPMPENIEESISEFGAETSSLHFDIYETANKELSYYRQRAVEEVTSLQLVEHVFAGVEREQMKVASVSFDDISVKKALHDFLQFIKDNPDNDNAIARAEFNLMQETEDWCLALSLRDKQISVIDLRRYCETTKPALSPQALQALARFYRNLPHNESIRAKFEMVITRLFTTGDNRNRRELILEREPIIEEISQFYAEWASVPMYSETEETELLLINLKFSDFTNEAEAATNFESLVKNDFYSRLRVFKEEIGDKFYAPQVLASAIECNVCVGNRFIDLLDEERKISSPEAIQIKYGFALDKTISEAAGKTFNLAEVLIQKEDKSPKHLNETKEKLDISKGSTKSQSKSTKQDEIQKTASGLFGISKWVLGLLIGTILLTAGLYFFVEFNAPPPTASSDVQTLNLENSTFKEYLVSAKISQELLIGITKEEWATLSEETKQEILGKLLNIGKEKGYNKVHLLNKEGVTVSHASEKEIVGTVKPTS